MLSFQPIQDQRLSDRIAEQFTSAMHNGELTVGTRLPPEAQLAEQLGVSRRVGHKYHGNVTKAVMYQLRRQCPGSWRS